MVKPRYSYSGSDTRAFAYFPGMEEAIVPIESLHTVSISVHDAKSQARSLGFRGARGTAGAVRTVAGSIITTVVEDHPLRPLASIMEQYVTNPNYAWGQWSLDRYRNGTGSALDRYDFTNRLMATLPEFNLLLVSVSELNQQQLVDARGNRALTLSQLIDIPAAMRLIEGISIVDESEVNSVNDIVTEITMSYFANNYRPLSLNKVHRKYELMYDSSSFDQKMRESRVNQLLFGTSTNDPRDKNKQHSITSINGPMYEV